LGWGEAGAVLGAGVLEKAAEQTWLCVLLPHVSAGIRCSAWSCGTDWGSNPSRISSGITVPQGEYLGGLPGEAVPVTPMGTLRALTPFHSVRRGNSHPHFSLLSPSSTPPLAASLSIFARFSIFRICR